VADQRSNNAADGLVGTMSQDCQLVGSRVAGVAAKNLEPWRCRCVGRSAMDVRSVREEFGDGRFADRGVLSGRADVDRHRRATEFERDLEASTARPGEVVTGPGRNEGQRERSGTERNRREESDTFGAHRQTEGDVLDDHTGDDVTGSGLNGGSGSELGVGNVGIRSTVPGGGYERGWRHSRQRSEGIASEIRAEVVFPGAAPN
jgi:hypothetical protein